LAETIIINDFNVHDRDSFSSGNTCHLGRRSSWIIYGDFVPNVSWEDPTSASNKWMNTFEHNFAVARQKNYERYHYGYLSGQMAKVLENNMNVTVGRSYRSSYVKIGALSYLQRFGRIIVAGDHCAPHQESDSGVASSHEESEPFQLIFTLFKVFGLIAIGTVLFEYGIKTSLNELAALPISVFGLLSAFMDSSRFSIPLSSDMLRLLLIA
jgi:hypothetical protein